MPDKVNPVIPEAATQAAMVVMANDQAIAVAAANGSLELNPFLPLVADRLLESIDLLTRVCRMLAERCVDGVEADEARCRAHVDASTATVTALLPALGYDRAGELARAARATGQSIRALAVRAFGLTEEQFDEMTSPEAVCRLGMKREERKEEAT
jgi:aspartate ammonia-lyase